MTSAACHRNSLLIALRELRNAPLRLKVMLAASVLYMALMIAFAVEKRGWDAFLTTRTIGAVMGGASGLLAGLSYSLYRVAQGRESVLCGGVKTMRMHPMLLALPVLMLIAAVMAAVSTGLILPMVVERPLAWLAVIATIVVLWFALNGLNSSTRFLYQHAQEQAQAAAEAREQVTQAQLEALRAQLHPHFLFNALNTVASLVRTDPKRAEAVVENLARILRRTLDRTSRQTIALADELDYTRAWLAIEQERHGNRLRVVWDVDPESRDCAVPPMTLQPLVENSLKHGIGKRIDGGTVRIRTWRQNGRLHMDVSDDGPGFDREWQDGTGLGNLRRRLETMYQGGAALGIRSNGGAHVHVELPPTSGEM
jgi:LytS/YehU family sensor histidine kinase